MEYDIKTVFGNETILKEFPKPSYLNIISDDNISEAIYIKWDDIAIDDNQGNVARASTTGQVGTDPAHVKDLEQSFSKGLNSSMYLPAVVKNPVGSAKKYRLIYGFGRSWALIALGTIGHAFNIIEGDETQIENVCSDENEPVCFYPKKTNTEQNIIALKVKQINRGVIKKDLSSVHDDLKKTYPRRSDLSRDRIAQAIMQHCNIAEEFYYYSKGKIIDFLKNKCFKTNVVAIDGKFDENLKMFGHVAKKGGLARTFMKALHKYVTSGYKSYVTMHVGTVSSGSEIRDKREQMIEEYVYYSALFLSVGVKDSFLSPLGFFPQLEDENTSGFIKKGLNKKTLNKLIQVELKRLEKDKQVTSLVQPVVDNQLNRALETGLEMHFNK